MDFILVYSVKSVMKPILLFKMKIFLFHYTFNFVSSRLVLQRYSSMYIVD